MPGATDRQDPKAQRVRLAVWQKQDATRGEVVATQELHRRLHRGLQKTIKEMSEEACAQ